MFYFVIGIHIVSVLLLLVELFYIFNHWANKQHSFLVLFVLAVTINNFAYLFELTRNSISECREAIGIIYLGKSFIPVLFLLFAFFFCNIKLPNLVTAVMLMLQFFVWVIVLTNGSHHLFYRADSYVEGGLISHIALEYGPLYYAFLIQTVLYVTGGCVLLLRHYFKVANPMIKKQILCLFGMIFFTASGITFYSMKVTGGIDTTNIGLCIGSIFVFVAILKYDLVGVLDEAKKFALENNSDGIIVKDSFGDVIFKNKVGDKIYRELSKKDVDMDLAVSKTVFANDEVYRLHEKEILNLDQKLGYVYLYKNITDGFYYTQRLQEEVEIQTHKAESRRLKVEQMSLQTIRSLAEAIDAKDKYTKGHSTRVAMYSVMLAKELGYSEEKLNVLRYAALLHDVGKIGVPDALLNKPTRLTNTEYDVIKAHCRMGGDILKNIDSIPEAEIVAKYHHERYDGTGYNEGLKGEDIPEIARIVAIADAYDAMSSKRVYRSKVLSSETIRDELVKGIGTQFDPNIVKVFIKMFDEDRLELVEDEYSKSHENEVNNIVKSYLDDGKETDSLTGLIMLTEGQARITDAIKTDKGCLAFIDVDNLKTINDTVGHRDGDRLLKTVADIIKRVQKWGIACRLGGDEFLFFMEGVDREKATEIVEEIIDGFESMKDEEPILNKSSLSIGLSMSTPIDSFVDVYNNADKALYYVKLNGKNNYHFYTKNEEIISTKRNIDLDNLVEKLKNRGSYDGALDVDYSVFAKMYEYTLNLGKRFDQEYNISMITIETGEELPIDEIEEAMKKMEQSIQTTIRNVDIYTKYSSVQFLIILLNAEDNIDQVVNRIFGNFYKLYQRHKVGLKYSVAKVPVEDE